MLSFTGNESPRIVDIFSDGRSIDVNLVKQKDSFRSYRVRNKKNFKDAVMMFQAMFARVMVDTTSRTIYVSMRG